MSWHFMTYLILDNEIDLKFIDMSFNLVQADDILTENGMLPVPVFYGNISPINDNYALPYLLYRGQLSIGAEKNVNKLCYSVVNGDTLFFRMKYSYYDSSKGVLVSRAGEEINFRGGPPANEQLHEQYAMDKPPVSELKSLFDHILSLNPYFYILFNEVHVDDKINDSKIYLETLLKEREIKEFNSEELQGIFIEIFNKRHFRQFNEDPNKVTFKIK